MYGVVSGGDRLALLGRSDTLNVVASDHRPFTIKQRAMGKDDFTKIPHGLPGVQDRMSVIWERGVVCAAFVSRVWLPESLHRMARVSGLGERNG